MPRRSLVTEMGEEKKMDKAKVLWLAHGELETHYAKKLIAGEMVGGFHLESSEEGLRWKNGGEKACNRLVQRLRHVGFSVRYGQYHAGGNAFLSGVSLSDTAKCHWCSKDSDGMGVTNRPSCADHRHIKSFMDL